MPSRPRIKAKQHPEAHLARYYREFDLRYNTREIVEGERAVLIVKGMEGKRLTYRRADLLAA